MNAKHAPLDGKNTFDGHLVSAELPKDASLASIGLIMYYIPASQKYKNIFYRRCCTLLLIYRTFSKKAPVSVPNNFFFLKMFLK